MARQSSSRRRRCPGWRQLAWTWCRGQRWPCSLLQPEPPRCTPCGWPRSWESSRCARACLCRWSSGHSPRPWRLRRTPHRRASRRRKVPGDRPLRRSEPVERVSAVCRTGHEASCCTSHYAAPGQSYPCPRGKSRFSNDTKKVRSRFQNIWNLSARLETPARAWQGKGLSSAAAGSLNSWWEFHFLLDSHSRTSPLLAWHPGSAINDGPTIWITHFPSLIHSASHLFWALLWVGQDKRAGSVECHTWKRIWF